MRFHLPSFLLGTVAGASGAVLAPRLRPLALEVATGCYRLLDAALVKVARGREAFADVLAEARMRARGTLRSVQPARVGAGT